MDIIKPLMELSKIRKIFHSEADFQFALAWEIQKAYPNAKVRLEYCPAGIEPVMHIDILVIIDEYWYPIELKYKTFGCTKIHEGEIYKLKHHGAQDMGRYDFLNDVQRIEHLSKKMVNFKKGYSILLTNDPAYWNDSGRIDTIYHEFRLIDGLCKTGEMKWASHASEGSIKGRETSIVLENNYFIEWQKYCEIDSERSGIFKYLMLSLEL